MYPDGEPFKPSSLSCSAARICGFCIIWTVSWRAEEKHTVKRNLWAELEHHLRTDVEWDSFKTMLNILIYNWNPNQETHNNNFTIVFVTIPSLLGGVLLSTSLAVCFEVWKQRLMSGYVHYECCIYIYAQQSKSALPLCSQTGDRWYNPSVRHIAHTYQSSVRLLLAGEKIKKTGSHFSLLPHPGHFACSVLQAKNQWAVWDAALSQINKLLWI